MKNIKAILSSLLILVVAGCSKPADPSGPEDSPVAPQPTNAFEKPPEKPAISMAETPKEPVDPVAATTPVPPPESVTPKEPEPAPEDPAKPVEAKSAASAPSPVLLVPPNSGTPETGKKLLKLTAELSSADFVQSDKVLSRMSRELGHSVQRLGGSAAGDLTLHGILQSSLELLKKERDADALAAYQKVSAVNLTQEQRALAQDAQNMITAYVARKSFSGLTSAEREVSQLVNAVRYGDVPATLKAVQGVVGNATLTAEQRAILNAIAARAAASK